MDRNFSTGLMVGLLVLVAIGQGAIFWKVDATESSVRTFRDPLKVSLTLEPDRVCLQWTLNGQPATFYCSREPGESTEHWAERCAREALVFCGIAGPILEEGMAAAEATDD